MCRPSCCNNSGGQEAGIAAVALITGAAPVAANVVHPLVEMIRFAALISGLVLAQAVFTWAAIAAARWQVRRKALAANSTRWAATRRWEQTQSANQSGCLACGGTGTVLRAISGGRYQPGECPVCEPSKRVG